MIGRFRTAINAWFAVALFGLATTPEADTYDRLIVALAAALAAFVVHDLAPRDRPRDW